MAKYIRIKNHKGQSFILFSGMYGVYRQVVEKCKEANVPIDIIYGWRGKEAQDNFCANGLSNAKFGSSPHNYGLAFDYWPLDKQGQFMRDTDISDYIWDKIGLIVEDCGLQWGGRFKAIVDKDHAENKDWRELVANGTVCLFKESPSQDDIEDV
jgi:hypothetical protein